MRMKELAASIENRFQMPVYVKLCKAQTSCVSQTSADIRDTLSRRLAAAADLAAFSHWRMVLGLASSRTALFATVRDSVNGRPEPVKKDRSRKGLRIDL